eukprot:3909804-Amphidinium_carterae.2
MFHKPVNVKGGGPHVANAVKWETGNQGNATAALQCSVLGVLCGVVLRGGRFDERAFCVVAIECSHWGLLVFGACGV